MGEVENGNLAKITQWLKQNRYSCLSIFLIVLIGSFMGFYCARTLPTPKEEQRIRDTVYVEYYVVVDTFRTIPLKTDSSHSSNNSINLQGGKKESSSNMAIEASQEFGVNPSGYQGYKSDKSHRTRELRRDKVAVEKIPRKNNNSMDKSYKIIICQSSEDKYFADALIGMMASIGIKNDDIFCSSYPNYGVEFVKDILDEIKMQYKKPNIIVLIVHSPHFYEDHIALNEMGIVWANNSKRYSFLMRDCRYSMLDGAINSDEVVFKTDQEDTYHCLDGFKRDLEQLMSLVPVEDIKWENAKEEFLSKIN